MLYQLQTAARRSFRILFQLMEQSRAADVLLFFAFLMVKLLLFNDMIQVRQMETTQADMIINAGTLALISFWTLWLPFRGRFIALAILNLFLTCLLYSDLIYFRYFQDFISVPVLMQAGQVGELGESIHSLIGGSDWIYFADWLIVVPLAVYTLVFRRRGRLELSFIKPRRIRKYTLRFTFSLLILAAGLYMVFAPINTAKKTWALGVFDGNWWNVSLYNVTGLYGYHGYDTYRYMKDQVLSNNSLPTKETAEAKQWFEERGAVRSSLESDPLFGAYKGSNVIMVQAEAFQNFLIGQSIGGQEITPNLNKLIGESVYFDHFSHQTAQGRTSDADFGVQCSLQPTVTGSVFIRYANHQFDCTPSILKNNGYTATVFHAYDGGFWNRNTMYAAMKYNTFYSKKYFNIDEPLGWSLSDDSFFRQSAAIMAKQQSPFYSFLITLSSHYPFNLPESYQKLDVGKLKGTIFGNYLQASHYVDFALGKFRDELKANGLWDKSIFLFYGDHDNSVRDWKPFETFLGRPIGAMERYQILKQVPFIVHLPDGALKGVHHEVGGQLDVSPTILHLLGISSSDSYMAGTPLLLKKPLAGKTVVFRSGAFTDGKLYYLPAADGVSSGSCYDTASGEAVNAAACTSGAAAARKQLAMSDRVVNHDLIPIFRGTETDAK